MLDFELEIEDESLAECSSVEAQSSAEREPWSGYGASHSLFACKS
jgi:hypothetical protein